jgi:hypothetical protein
MTSDLVFPEGYLDTGLRDIRQLHGQTATLTFALRSAQPGMVVYLRNLTFWKDPYNGNRPPAANAGLDQIVSVNPDGLASVTLDGSGTSDPDGDALTYWWMVQGEILADGPQPTVALSPGRYLLQLVVRDPANHISTAEVLIVVNALFSRGDANADGVVDVSDAVFTLLHLFTGRVQARCLDAADANDDGAVNISDAIAMLGFLFLGNPAEIKAPYPDRGADPTPDALGCESYGR